MKLVFATGNLGKLKEAAEILGPGYELLSAAQAGVTEEIPETGDTLKDNSLQKAMYLYEKTGLDCFADDTGLEVDALGGAPGVHSARYAGPGHDFEANIDKLLAELAECPEGTPRTARFRCVVTLILGGETYFFDGRMEGKIALQRSGTQGFGYDSVFIPDGFGGRTMAELGTAVKNEVSHRALSLRKLAEFLADR